VELETSIVRVVVAERGVSVKLVAVSVGLGAVTTVPVTKSP
jgi:hypothetical protein